MVHPVLDKVHHRLGLSPSGGHPRPLDHRPAVAHGVVQGVDNVDVEGIPGLGVVLVELPPGLIGVGAGGRALGVDGGVDQVGIPLLPGRLKQLGEHIGVELGVGGNFGGRQKHIVKLLGSKVKAVLILPVSHGDGEGEHLDSQLLPQPGGDIGGGVGGEFDARHSWPPLSYRAGPEVHP